MTDKPKTSNSASEKEMVKLEKQFSEFESDIKEMTLDRMNHAPREESEGQTRLSNNQISNSKDIYIKPKRTMSCKEKFNETYRDSYEFAKQYVLFIAENKEIIGETIDMWTKPFAGVPAEEWEIPTNKPVWAPRYVAEQIKKCSYHRFSMRDVPTQTVGVGTMYGSMAVDNVVQRLDAIPTTKKKSIFMGNEGF